jgi:hypothetical protein
VETVAASPWVLAAAVGFSLVIGYGLGHADKGGNSSGEPLLWDRVRLQLLASGIQWFGIHSASKSTDAGAIRTGAGAGAAAAREFSTAVVGAPPLPTGSTSTAPPFRSAARHVAIIMDGNRRYGTSKHGDALQGHADGGQTLVDCVQWCLEAGVGALTVYAFSTENWARPPAEVDLLMSIFVKYAARCEEEALKNNLVRLCWPLPQCVQRPQQRGRLLLSPQP